MTRKQRGRMTAKQIARFDKADTMTDAFVMEYAENKQS